MELSYNFARSLTIARPSPDPRTCGRRGLRALQHLGAHGGIVPASALSLLSEPGRKPGATRSVL